MKKQKCLNPKCSSGQITRGLCASCYQTARRLSISKKTTWEKLESDGKCVKNKSGGWLKQTSQWLLK